MAVAPARTADEPEAARRMVERTRERHGAGPHVLTADTAYGSAHFLAWTERQGMEAHVPMINTRDGTGRRPPKEAFAYDPASDTYTCPKGKVLRPVRHNRDRSRADERPVSYFPSRRDCAACPIKADCAPGGTRIVHRSANEARERAKAREGTASFERSQRLRLRVEHLFADIKHNDGLKRMRLRGRRGADEQVTLAATARNLKKMIRLMTQTDPAQPVAA